MGFNSGFKGLTNYLIDCCHLVSSTPLREICCIAASSWNLSSQAIKLMYWFCRHDCEVLRLYTCFIFLQTKWMNSASPCLGHQPRGDVWRKGDIELRSTEKRRISYLTSERTTQALGAFSKTQKKPTSKLLSSGMWRRVVWSKWTEIPDKLATYNLPCWLGQVSFSENTSVNIYQTTTASHPVRQQPSVVAVVCLKSHKHNTCPNSRPYMKAMFS